MLLKYFKAKKVSMDETDYPKYLIHYFLKAANALNLFKDNFNYNGYFNKVVQDVFNRRKVIIYDKSLHNEMVSNAFLNSINKEMVTKYLKLPHASEGIEKYLAKVVENKLNNDITVYLNTESKKKDFYDNYEPEIYYDNLLNELQYKELIKHFCIFLKKHTSKQLYVDIFLKIIEGYKVSDIAKKFNFSNIYIFKLFSQIRDYLKQFSITNSNPELTKLIERYDSRKFSTEEEEVEHFCAMFQVLYSSKKTASLIKIKSYNDVLNPDYILKHKSEIVSKNFSLNDTIFKYLSTLTGSEDVIQISPTEVVHITKC